MNKPTELKITEEAPEGLINEASMSAARELIGSKLRTSRHTCAMRAWMPSRFSPMASAI